MPDAQFIHAQILKKKDASFQKALTARSEALPKALKPRLKAVVAQWLGARDNCLKKSYETETDSCLSDWYRHATEDLESHLDWHAAGGGTKISTVALADWIGRLREPRGADQSALIHLIQEVDPGFALSTSQEGVAQSPSQLFTLKDQPRLEVTESSRKVGGKDATLILARWKSDTYATPAWTWVGIFDVAQDGKAKLRYDLQRINYHCGKNDPFVLQPAGGEPLIFTEQMVDSCGLSVIYDFRSWSCSEISDQMACLVTGRID